ncbi:MAG: DUF547 domain-containing protein [Verrucomicrobiota bacterium]
MSTPISFCQFRVAAALLLTVVSTRAAFDQTHAGFDRLLKQHVSDGWVDYARLKADPKPRSAYLDQLAAVTEAEFSQWSEKARLAFLINLYNAATLKLIVDHYPVRSIKDIGGLFSSPWKQEAVRLFGRVTTLDAVEHDILRKLYAEPRIHFALVYAAKGCSPLRREAYVASRLDEQLDDQARLFLASQEKNRVVANERTVYLSPIFKWFAGDFEKHSGSVLTFIEPYLPEADRRALAGHGLKIRYTDYDWSLNDRPKK